MLNPIRPSDDNARALAGTLLKSARTAALAVLSPDGAPLVTRIAFGSTPDGQPLTLVSDLSGHTIAMRSDPRCSLLVGEINGRGDPLNQPRLTLEATASFLDRTSTQHEKMVAHYLRDHPKSKLYIGFADFSFVLFTIKIGHLNGGFGKAFTLSSADLASCAS
ncbi:HugZ family pyridoxamine 5'-phosphate oxidase [Sedimentitalea todarodis]|uniref:Pyridoxamine 5'-phosphate oxidase family protein n=1 Tax=Sedimentitalea todarodis TaxID=1631240 RepID=A0ABU3VFL3_9RHOB|nr:pyridoxamine 5'-phosphate oxidase family protein [Sedimentitalea todarodis]MDU9004959.1 pyridoxamine 5'-phosphate oxidase family protein [Sedimentitalea todarodis]